MLRIGVYKRLLKQRLCNYFIFGSTICKIERTFEELFNFLMVICSEQK